MIKWLLVPALFAFQFSVASGSSVERWPCIGESGGWESGELTLAIQGNMVQAEKFVGIGPNLHAELSCMANECTGMINGIELSPPAKVSHQRDLVTIFFPNLSHLPQVGGTVTCRP